MRLFIALDIDDEIRKRITRFIEGVLPFAPDARWMKPGSLHVTLKFIGEQPDDTVEQIKRTLETVTAIPIQIHFRGCGFFPTPKAARVFWIGMEADQTLPSLAAMIDEKTSALGIPKEDRAYSPHLTLARGGGGSGSPSRRTGDGPNRTFKLLQDRLSSLSVPDFGMMTAREFFPYQSKLSPKGSEYTKLARFELH